VPSAQSFRTSGIAGCAVLSYQATTTSCSQITKAHRLQQYITQQLPHTVPYRVRVQYLSVVDMIKWFKPLKLNPKTGDIVVFPSYLYHHVQTYNSNIRLALPVDLFLFNSQ
jgi:hypothetical protein